MKQFILTKEPVLGSEGVMYVPWGNVTFFYGGDGAERSYFSYRRKEDVKSAERGGRVGGKRNTIRKKLSIYILMMLYLTMATGFSSCNSDNDNPETELPPYMEEKIPITIGTQRFMLSVFDNPAGRAFKALLPLTISMEDVNGNEKFYRLPQGLPQTAANPGTIRTGDMNLYGSDGLVLFYKTFSTSYNYTRIGSVDNPSGLQSALGAGSVMVTFE